MKTLNLQSKLSEVFWVEPNDLGNPLLTSIFKRTTKRLKRAPFIVLIPVSTLIAILIYSLLGLSIIRYVNILQHGF